MKVLRYVYINEEFEKGQIWCGWQAPKRTLKSSRSCNTYMPWWPSSRSPYLGVHSHMATTCGGSHIALQSIVIIPWRKVCRLHSEHDSRESRVLKSHGKKDLQLPILTFWIALRTSKKPSKKYNEQSVMKITITAWLSYVMYAYEMQVTAKWRK